MLGYDWLGNARELQNSDRARRAARQRGAGCRPHLREHRISTIRENLVALCGRGCGLRTEPTLQQ